MKLFVFKLWTSEKKAHALTTSTQMA